MVRKLLRINSLGIHPAPVADSGPADEIRAEALGLGTRLASPDLRTSHSNETPCSDIQSGTTNSIPTR